MSGFSKVLFWRNKNFYLHFWCQTLNWNSKAELWQAICTFQPGRLKDGDLIIFILIREPVINVSPGWEEKRCVFIGEGWQKQKKGHLANALELEAEVILRIDDNIFLLLCSDEKGVCWLNPLRFFISPHTGLYFCQRL